MRAVKKPRGRPPKRRRLPPTVAHVSVRKWDTHAGDAHLNGDKGEATCDVVAGEAGRRQDPLDAGQSSSVPSPLEELFSRGQQRIAIFDDEELRTSDVHDHDDDDPRAPTSPSASASSVDFPPPIPSAFIVSLRLPRCLRSLEAITDDIDRHHQAMMDAANTVVDGSDHALAPSAPWLHVGGSCPPDTPGMNSSYSNIRPAVGSDHAVAYLPRTLVLLRLLGYLPEHPWLRTWLLHLVVCGPWRPLGGAAADLDRGCDSDVGAANVGTSAAVNGEAAMTLRWMQALVLLDMLHRTAVLSSRAWLCRMESLIGTAVGKIVGGDGQQQRCVAEPMPLSAALRFSAEVRSRAQDLSRQLRRQGLRPALVILPSQIEGAGNGLFLRGSLPKGSRVAIYSGVREALITYAPLSHRRRRQRTVTSHCASAADEVPETKPYPLHHEDNSPRSSSPLLVDAPGEADDDFMAPLHRASNGYRLQGSRRGAVLDARVERCVACMVNDPRGTRYKANCRFASSHGTNAVVTVRDVADEELFVKYGSTYRFTCAEAANDEGGVESKAPFVGGGDVQGKNVQGNPPTASGEVAMSVWEGWQQPEPGGGAGDGVTV